MKTICPPSEVSIGPQPTVLPARTEGGLSPAEAERLMSLPTEKLRYGAIDATEKQFGRLKALRPVRDLTKKHNALRWLCMCSCGTLTLACYSGLRNGSKRSCGCLERELLSKRSTADIAGQSFHQLTAIRRTSLRKRTWYLWECLCTCGNTTLATVTELRGGDKKSCGCRNEHTRLERIRRLNKSGRMKKESHPNWNPDLTDDDRKKYRPSISPICQKAYERDNHTCQVCGKSPEGKNQLAAHHLETWYSCKERRYDLTNLITLCKSCHAKYHREHGRKKANTKSFREWQQKQKEKLHGRTI